MSRLSTGPVRSTKAVGINTWRLLWAAVAILGALTLVEAFLLVMLQSLRRVV